MHTLFAVILLTASISGCAGMVDSRPTGETGVWELQAEPSRDSTSIDIVVSRLECASGVTGELLDPLVRYEDNRVVVTTPVADNGTDDGECQGNNGVALNVSLGEALGERILVDGACLDTDARTTTLCDDPVRWRP
ncbi:hypothetical protein LG315_02420 [Microbacterium marinum]|uniref:hypothetical protein n=1 Tax=Microbacterium marinum TaxID=421115 RepID=UPI00384BF0D5